LQPRPDPLGLALILNQPGRSFPAGRQTLPWDYFPLAVIRPESEPSSPSHELSHRPGKYCMKALARFFLDTVVRYTYYITMRITHHVLRRAILMIRKTKDDAELDDFGRFSEPALLILVSLAEGPRHGYSMTEDIEAIADVRLGPGTLYGALARLEARGLIEPLKSEDRRNPYRLTALGERALRARLDSMMAVARTGQRRLANA
jgi:DNA-binding PadR family transcriptional regulator